MSASIHTAWLLTRNILKVSFRKKATLITFFILPILGVLFSVAAYSSFDSGVSRIGLVDRDQSMVSKDLTQSLVGDNQFKVAFMNAREMSGAIVAGKVDCAVVIPPGFGESLSRNRFQKVKIVSLKGEVGSAWIKSYLNVLLLNLKDVGAAAGGGRKQFARIYAAYRQEPVTMKVVNVGDQIRGKGITSQSIGFLILFMLIGVGNSVEMILKEKRNRTYFRIRAAPVPGWLYIFGNVLANLLIIMIQVFLALLVICEIFRFNAFVPFWQLYLILVLFGLAAIGLGLLIVAFAKDTTQAGILQNLIIVPTCFLTGCFWPVDIMPPVLRRIGDFLPQKWAISAVQTLQEGADFERVFIHIAVILAFALAFFLVAAYRFSRNDDVKAFV